MKRFAVMAVLALCLPIFCSAQKAISSSAQSLIDSFFTVRMNLSLHDKAADVKAIIAEIDKFNADNKAAIEACTEQEKLIISNLIAMEKYNYLYEIKTEKENQRQSMKAQKDACETYFKTHDPDNSSKWLLCTQADVTSCYMGFSISDVMKYGMTIKPLYQKALDADPNFAYGQMNIAQWYYFAPAVTGGSKKKSLDHFEKAAVCAHSAGEKYYADIFLSQLLFEFKKYERSTELLNKAAALCPNSTYIATIRNANKNGMSLFEYNRSKSSLNEESKKK